MVVLVGNTNRGTLFLAVRGLPWVVLVVLAILVIYTTLLGRTRFGRYIYAIGGNTEAARRAGVNTNRVRVLAFALCTSACSTLDGLLDDGPSPGAPTG